MKKILAEQKEKMPLSVVTSWIAKSWDEVGSITEMIKSIKASFTHTGNIEEYLQSIADAYLICIGQMEKFLQDKDYVEIPEGTEEVKESLTESGSIANLDQAAWQRQVDSENEKFGRIGAATYDDLDRDGFYLDAEDKVQPKVPNKSTTSESLDYDEMLTALTERRGEIEEDWVLDWSINDTENASNGASGSLVIDTNPTDAEIEAAKREVGGKPAFVTPAVERHPIEDDFYIDFDADFPAPTAQQLSDKDIEAFQGIKTED